jgi:hypothetical protein
VGAEFPLDGAQDRELRKAVRELLQRVGELEAATGGAEAVRPRAISDSKLATVASSFYGLRRLRAKYFDPALVAEPAWDMLLDLFIASIRGARVATTSLCLAARVPQATGLRWIAVLQKHSLVRRYKALDDHRLKLVEITPKGFSLMRGYLSDSIERYPGPPPD